MQKKRVVVYTAIFGEYDGLLPQPRMEGVEFVCFTDHPLRGTPWKIKLVAPTNTDPVRSAKVYKILPHRFFPDHDVSIWIDGNMLVTHDLHDLIADHLDSHNMAIFDHNQSSADMRDCVYQEYESIIKLGKITGRYKDDPKLMKAQIDRYREEGYPPHNGLIVATVLVRRHHAADVVRAMERWWQEISFGSRRDQLSFNYTVWCEKVSFAIIEGNIRRNRWFHMIGVHRSDYRWKMFRYRLRRFLGIKHT